mmetsp:Transcript_35591/g.68247  ORF Transcript_35591/g.68247 Transcript_35591/m.68247 type:complete len:438 (-) Transcript_35591:346-1659(-)
MGDPAQAIGGVEGEWPERWQARDVKFMETIQRRQKMQLERELDLATVRKKIVLQSKSNKGTWFHPSVTLTGMDRSIMHAHTDSIREAEDDLRRDLEEKYEYKQEILEELNARRAEHERAKGDKLRALQENAQIILTKKERELEARRDEWAQKQIETMEAQLAAQEARIKEKKESIQKLKEHRNEIKTNWKKNKVEGYKEVVQKEEEREKMREKRLRELKKKQEMETKEKLKQRDERRKALREKLLNIAVEERAKRHRYQEVLDHKAETTERVAAHMMHDFSASIQERKQWRDYIQQRKDHQDQLDTARRAYLERMSHRRAQTAVEVEKRRDQVKQINRSLHMKQSENYFDSKEDFNDKQVKIRNSTSMEVKLPEMKQKIPPGLKPMKVPPSPSMPDIQFSQQSPGLPIRMSYKKAMQAGQLVISDNEHNLSNLRATL